MGIIEMALEDVLADKDLRHDAEDLVKAGVKAIAPKLAAKVDHEAAGHAVLIALHRHLKRVAK